MKYLFKKSEAGKMERGMRDVVGGKSERVVLKRKTLRFEVGMEDVQRFLRKNVPLSISAGIVFVLIAGYFLLVSRADTAQFYPSSCLGGWENPQYAQGEPNLGESAVSDDFTSSNSAVLRNSISQIFCGGFSGNTLENTKVEKLTLHLSLAIKNGVILDTTSSPDIAPIATSSDTMAPDVATTTAPDTSAATATISFLRNFVNVAFADDTIDTSTQTVVAPPTDTVPAPDPATDTSVPVVSSTDTVVITDTTTTSDVAPLVSSTDNSVATDTSSSSTATSSPVVAPPADENIFDVLYPTDGTNWQNLGEVTLQNWQNLSFDIPALDWADISKVQISLKSVSPVSSVFTAYLDGMWLEVGYSQVAPPAATSTDSLLSSAPADPSFLNPSLYSITLPGQTAASHNLLTVSIHANTISDLDPYTYAQHNAGGDFNYWQIEAIRHANGGIVYSQVFPASDLAQTVTMNLPAGDYDSVYTNIANAPDVGPDGGFLDKNIVGGIAIAVPAQGGDILFKSTGQ